MKPDSNLLPTIYLRVLKLLQDRSIAKCSIGTQTMSCTAQKPDCVDYSTRIHRKTIPYCSQVRKKKRRRHKLRFE